MINVSTKTGDQGESGLANGQRLPKDHPIFEVLGTLDELNSHLGVVLTYFPDHSSNTASMLFSIQENLFHIGGELAGSHKVVFTKEKLLMLEEESERMQASMEKEWYTKFLLPGGSPVAASLDVARTVCRRLERRLVTLSHTQVVSPLIAAYINRLSDYLYVVRCKQNFENNYKEHPFIS